MSTVSNLKRAALLAFPFALFFQMAAFLPKNTVLYSLIPYSTTYGDDVWRRVLLSSLLTPLGFAQNWMSYSLLMMELHVAACFYLGWILIGHHHACSPIRKWLMWCLAGSTILPVLAFHAGYADIFLAIGLWHAHRQLALGQVWRAVGIGLLLLLVHEISAVFFLGLMLAHLAIKPTTKAGVTAASFAAIAAGFFFLSTSTPLPGHCAAFFKGLPEDGLRTMLTLCAHYQNQSFAGVFDPTRLMLAPLALMDTGIFVLILAALVILCWRPGAKTADAPFLLSVLFAFGGIVSLLVASDHLRFCGLALFSLWLVVDLWMDRRPTNFPAASKTRLALIVLAALPFLFDYAIFPTQRHTDLMLGDQPSMRPLPYHETTDEIAQVMGLEKAYQHAFRPWQF